MFYIVDRIEDNYEVVLEIPDNYKKRFEEINKK